VKSSSPIPSPGSAAIPPPTSSGALEPARARLLIVDDTPPNIDLLRAVLAELGCDLSVATSGQRALDLVARQPPDLLLLDVMMPGMDGFEVCRRLKADEATAGIPVIFVTARGDDVAQGFAVGGADYIAKPIQPDEVRARVRHQLERQMLLRQLRSLNLKLEETVRERTAELTLTNRRLRAEINERRYMQDRLNYLATHDFVTRLYNRGALDGHVSELLARVQRREARGVFLLLDIDQFRLVNESCGCIAGDELLREFGDLMAAALERSDFLARLGGDKFGVVCEGRDAVAGLQLARRLLELLQAHEFTWDQRSFRLGAAAAVVELHDQIVSFEQLMLMADEAAYLAKREGKGTVKLYEAQSTPGQVHRETVNWALLLLDAMRLDHFRVYFQRLQPLRPEAPGQKKMRIEVLARLVDPARHQLVMPASFIPPAERFHLIGELDRWMLRHVVALLGQQPQLQELLGQVSLNLSAVSIREPGLAEQVIELLQQHAVPPSLLNFEITETEAIVNLKSAREFMHRLRAAGCSFSLDDFGSGFASFAYLRELPFDTLKIDGVFVRDMDVDETHFAMVRSMVEMAGLLGKPVVAEFVEREAVAGQLRQLGVEWAQGYLYHRPEELTAQALQREVALLSCRVASSA
jgi:diguanylate cyclase (GGDEF)-like protein